MSTTDNRRFKRDTRPVVYTTSTIGHRRTETRITGMHKVAGASR